MGDPARTASGHLLEARSEAVVWATPAACRVCGEEGHPVRRETLGNHVREPFWTLIAQEGFRFCRSAGCPVVYYHPDQGTYFDRLEVRTRVGIKETRGPIPVCYCMNVLEKQILEEIKGSTGARTGRLCHITNPSGRCCGSHVRIVIEKGLARRGEEDLARRAREIGSGIPED